MRQFTTEHITEDLKVAMRMRGEAVLRRHAVFIQHTQRAEFLVLCVLVAGECEGVVCVQPAVICVAALVASAGHYFGVG